MQHLAEHSISTSFLAVGATLSNTTISVAASFMQPALVICSVVGIPFTALGLKA